MENFILPFISLLNEMSPYLLLGFLIAGILKVYVPKEIYTRNLAQPDFRSVLLSALAGVPIPLCSCGVIPTAMSLHKEGASKGATVSFLISTPQTGVDSIAATYSLLGLPFAIIRPLVAFVTGLVGGVITNKLDKNPDLAPITEDNCEVSYKPKNKLLQVLHYGFVEMIEDIGKWLVIGIVGAGLIAVFVPDNFFTAYLNNPFLNMLIVLAISVPMYICATGSIPLAAVLMMKGLSPGAALVLLMAGPATNIATMTVMGKVLGKKSLIIYLLSISLGAISFGLLIDTFLPSHWFSMNHEAIHGSHHHDAFSWIKSISSVLLVGLLINSFIQKQLQSIRLKKATKGGTKSYKIDGMTCNHCKANVEKTLRQLKNVRSVAVDLEKGIAYVEGNSTEADIKQSVEEIGYSYKGKI
jgi:uncharacterized membrane protein YraQ (UPF0718 family)